MLPHFHSCSAIRIACTSGPALVARCHVPTVSGARKGLKQAAPAHLQQELVEKARGVAPGSYCKAWASLKAHTPEHLAEMEECARYLDSRKESGERLRGLCCVGGLWLDERRRKKNEGGQLYGLG